LRAELENLSHTSRGFGDGSFCRPRAAVQRHGAMPWKNFRIRRLAKAWRERAPLESSWKKKCDLLPPLARGEGGVVIFTQFLHTQAALADSLRTADVEAFVINGCTPAPERQPITEEFQKRGAPSC